MSRKTSILNPPAKDLIWLLDRALNTMEPEKIPKWALDLSDGIRETDEVEIKLTREVSETNFNQGDHP